ncbi:MAG: alanine racemase, partial [Oscillospiraceae bacterium]|nr:alanine racemase [Oscillospiraceae bacterium]
MTSFIIEREKIEENAREIISRAGAATVIAVVKGCGYGFGLDEYISLLYGCGIRFFAVTDVSDALAIRRKALPDTNILMLRSTALPDEVASLIDNDIILTIGSTDAAVAANKVASEKGKITRVHIKIDTGMGRYGFSPLDTEQIVSAFTSFSSLSPCGLFTHLTSAFKSRSVTEKQVSLFLTLKNELEARGIDCGMIHFANSAYLFRFRTPLGDAVRVGSAFTGRIACKVRRSGLSRVGRIESNVCETRWLAPGSKVGYGGAYTAKRAVKTAVIPVGYSDGFCTEKSRDTYRLRDGLFYLLSDIKRTLSRKAVYVKINGRHARVIGHIGMTHTVCDVTDIPCETGDKAEF